MHSYLRAIGFSDLSRKELEQILEQISKNKKNMLCTERKDGSVYAEMSQNFAENIGIHIRGELLTEQNDAFQREYYYPYFKGTQISTRESTSVEKHAEKESFAGICDDVRVGVSLIFYLQNAIEYMSMYREGMIKKYGTSVILSALSTGGKIILPIEKTDRQIRSNKEATKNRNYLMAAARQGDEDAIESLTLEDIDTYTMISRRIMYEDVFSIVDSYFMPYGIESDQYSVMGNILDVAVTKNNYTQEELYILTIDSNDLKFDVCINKKDLLGEPKIGRRFKGTIWMQGFINFENMH